MNFDAVIFDLDGVITKTAQVHGKAWKEMFDEYLKGREEKYGELFKEFTHADDYLPYVDGKPRYKGVADFLKSRDIEIPYGDPSDDPGKETVCGLGNRKNKLFTEVLERDGVEIFDTTVDFINELKRNDIRVGVASSSKNCKPVLEVAKLDHLFETRVDGVVSAELGLKGKPEADIFTTACDNLGVSYHRSVVVEDAVSGVQAGKNGNFGLVLGVAREENINELKANGADIVVQDIGELGGINAVEEWFDKGIHEDCWVLRYSSYERKKEKSREALLAIGNGYLGSRGNLEEATDNEFNYPGTYINGLYNRLTSKVGKSEVENEDFVNCPNWTLIKLRVNGGEWMDINDTKILSLERWLDLKSGTLHAELVIEKEDGKQTMITSKRTASMTSPHLVLHEYNVKAINYSGRIELASIIDGQIINDGVSRYRDLNQHHLEPVKQNASGNQSWVEVKTTSSDIHIVEYAHIDLEQEGKPLDAQWKNKEDNGRVETTVEVNLETGGEFSISRKIATYTSKKDDVENPLESARELINSCGSCKDEMEKSKMKWADIWKSIDIKIEGDRQSLKLLRLHMYHLLVTASPNTVDMDTGIPPRGLHGEAYRGHIFWDELYILPFYNIHFPEVTKNALKYRYNRLGAARKLAKEEGYKGAMFPWQSGSDGREESQILHLNPVSGEWDKDYSSLQRHISIAIAYNTWQYYHVTEDLDFMKEYGAELFLDICKFWESISSYNEKTGKYEIKRVMGPDEFHEKYPGAEDGGLKDNAYTNIMVAWLFNRANDLINDLDNDTKNEIFTKIDTDEDEINKWKKIARSIHLEISNDGIIAQFEGFFNLKDIDFNKYKEKYGDIHRMDRILKAENKSPDEYKVAKQADTLMVFYNLPVEVVTDILEKAEYDMPEDYVEKNYRYYLNHCSHGSTLSRVVYSYLSHLAGKEEDTEKLYREALLSDYVDIQGGTTGEGIHAGVMGGTIYLALSMFAGIDLRKNKISIDPDLPEEWDGMNFEFNFKNDHYILGIQREKLNIEITSPGKDEVEVWIRGKKHLLKTSEKNQVSL